MKLRRKRGERKKREVEGRGLREEGGGGKDRGKRKERERDGEVPILFQTAINRKHA